MVKLLRLCIDYGENKILDIKYLIPSQVISTVDIVRTYLNEPVDSSVIYLSSDEVLVDSVDLTHYDKKYGMEVN